MSITRTSNNCSGWFNWPGIHFNKTTLTIAGIALVAIAISRTNNYTFPITLFFNSLECPPYTTYLRMLSTVGTAFSGVKMAHAHYDAKDDVRLLRQLTMRDCGGLSKMGSETEECYREYLASAIHRIDDEPDYRNKMRDLFDSCFEGRPTYECTWSGWWNSDLISKATLPDFDPTPRARGNK